MIWIAIQVFIKHTIYKKWLQRLYSDLKSCVLEKVIYNMYNSELCLHNQWYADICTFVNPYPANKYLVKLH